MVKAKTTQGKRLQPGSVLEKYDIDDDGEITDNEINDIKEIEEIERLNRRQKHQRMMAWYSLVGMISYCLLYTSDAADEP